MNSERRRFLRSAGAFTLGLGIRGVSPLAAQTGGKVVPTERAKALTAAFGIEYPIFQAGMGGTAFPELAAAVSNGGGLGAIGLTGGTPERVRELVNQTRAATKRPFAVNYILARDHKSFPAALEAGAPIVQFSFGLPSREYITAIRAARAKWGLQISSPEGAARAVELGADYLICQGTEAGGHVQATRPLEATLARVIEAAKSTPVLAAGGIADGSGIRRALLAGASGALMGTRFVATREANAHEVWKAALTRATEADTVFTVCFQDGWPNAPHRVLRNRTLTEWEAAGSPPPGQRPGEGEVVATNGTLKRIRYSTSSPRRDDVGKVDELALYSGSGVGAVRDIPGAGELVARLWRDCLAT